ncbi:MAG: hypothetical protein QM731_25375 [Chitinophagaceae bacterium]
MKSIYLIIALAGLAACSKSSDKDKNSTFPQEGVWVETSLQHDTINFDINRAIWSWPASESESIFDFRSRSFVDPAINPDYPFNLSSYYRYKITVDSIQILSVYSSSSVFRSYAVKYEDATHFTIGRFYARNALPLTVRFTRIR